MSNKNTIKLEKLHFFGFHGINKNEIKNGQDFVLNLVIHYDLIKKTDNIDDFIDYIELYNLIKDSFEEKRFNLLESLEFFYLHYHCHKDCELCSFFDIRLNHQVDFELL